MPSLPRSRCPTCFLTKISHSYDPYEAFRGGRSRTKPKKKRSAREGGKGRRIQREKKRLAAAEENPGQGIATGTFGAIPLLRTREIRTIPKRNRWSL